MERGRTRVGGLCYSGVKIPSDMVATVNATMVEFIRIGLYGDCYAILSFFSILHFVFLTYELAVKFSVCIVGGRAPSSG